MYRIRLHGRGGQGIKTAGRMLGSALFAEGFEVQDAPRYGAERRGAPIFATVRASRRPIHERGIITRPDLVIVADTTLVPVAAAGVLSGVAENTTLLLNGDEAAEIWKSRLKLAGPVFALPCEGAEARALPLAGAACAGGAARLLGAISREALARAIEEELSGASLEVVAANLECALDAYARLETAQGSVSEGPEADALPHERPDWIELPFDEARIAAPGVRGTATSIQVRTGLWRTMRPVIDRDRCRRCHWVCSTLCPDSAIRVDERDEPQIDLEHCKGCMICVAVCPSHAIGAVPESEVEAEAAANGEGASA